MTTPIITSLLDNDYYQFKMSYFFWNMNKENTSATYKLFNRKDTPIASYVNKDRLRNELDNLFSLNLTFKEAAYLIKLGFSEEYVNSLIKFLGRKPIYDVHTNFVDMNNSMCYTGSVISTILYETPILAIINELYFESLLKTFVSDSYVLNSMKNILDIKLNALSQNSGINFIEFGTRRRFSKQWQNQVYNTILEKNIRNNKFLGTSNILASMISGHQPLGTIAHQAYMAYAAMVYNNNDTDESRIKHSQTQLITDWLTLYGSNDTYWLTDTFGSEWFMKYVYKPGMNLRQDSGDPKEILNLYIKTFQAYDEFGADKPIKKVMFSDGLNLQTILQLHSICKGMIDDSYGWGTDLTCDGPLSPLSVVIKLFDFNSVPTVKLSDVPSKAMGSRAEVELFRKIFS